MFICADGDPPDEHWIAYSWTIILIAESVLLSLSVYKGWQDSSSGYASSFVRTLTRQSVLYFFA